MSGFDEKKRPVLSLCWWKRSINKLSSLSLWIEPYKRCNRPYFHSSWIHHSHISEGEPGLACVLATEQQSAHQLPMLLNSGSDHWGKIHTHTHTSRNSYTVIMWEPKENKNLLYPAPRDLGTTTSEQIDAVETSITNSFAFGILEPAFKNKHKINHKISKAEKHFLHTESLCVFVPWGRGQSWWWGTAHFRK